MWEGKQKKGNWKRSSFLVFLPIPFVILVVALLILEALRIFYSTNAERQAYQELESSAKTRAAVFEGRVDGEFRSLESIVDCVEAGMTFEDADDIDALSLIVSANKICMLGLSDAEGNAVNCRGEQMGNISDRSYFSELASGEAERMCVYLAEPKGADGPRVIFALPVERDGEFAGVVFESKEISVLEDTLLADYGNDSSVGMSILDENYNILVRNEVAGDTMERAAELAQKKESSTQKDGELLTFYDSESEMYVGIFPIEMNNWKFCCTMDKENAETAGRASSKRLLGPILLVIAAAVLAALSFVFSRVYDKRTAHRNEEWLRMQSAIQREMLNQMDCAVIEHDMRTGHYKSNENFRTMFGGNGLNGKVNSLEKFEQLHPELNLDEFRTVQQTVIETAKPASFDTAVEPPVNDVRWLNVIMVPVTQADGEVAGLFMTIRDVSLHHTEYVQARDFLDHDVPGGVISAVLEPELRLKHVSGGLASMLGFSADELEDMIESADGYRKLAAEEDRKKFAEFLETAAEKCGTRTLECRFVAKDGARIPVRITLDAARNVAGEVRAHAVILNVCEQVKYQMSVEQELEETKEKLANARLKVFSGQMQPHFLYNALASIREVVLLDPQRASDLIYAFTIHLRACIKSMASDELIPFTKERENIAAYLEIERMRFGDRLRVEWNLEDEDFWIVPLGIQPLVENAVRHGIYDRGKAGGTVHISSCREEGMHVVKVRDDGVGFDVEETLNRIEQGDVNSAGLRNLIYRFRKVMGAEVEIRSEKDIGTEVTVRIPEKEKNENDSRG